MEDAQERAQALAAAAKSGDAAAVNALWAAYADFINRRVSWWYAHHTEQAQQRGLELEDFQQEGYFALRRAAELYIPAPDGMSFGTYLTQRIHASCALLLKRGGADPLNNCTSLDIEVSGTGDADKAIPLAELVPDNSAEAAILSVDDADYQSALHEGLEAALNKLQERDADMLRRRYYQGQEVNFIAAEYGISRQSTSTHINTSLRKLRTAPELQEYHDRVLPRLAWQHSGFRAWKDGQGSVEERAIEALEKHKALVAEILEKYNQPAPQAHT